MEPESTDELAVLAGLRDRVLQKLLKLFAFGGLGIAVLFVTQAALGGYLRPRMWLAAIVAQALFLLRRLHARLGYRRTAILFLAYLILAPGYAQMFRGLTPGSSLSTVAVLLLASLFFGVRGLVVSGLACLAVLGVSGVLITQGLVAAGNPALWDLHEPIVWVRYAVVVAFWGGALGSSFLDVIRGLEQSGEQLRATLESERHERAQREAAQRELERAGRLSALAQIAGGLAHEFNNSLSVVMGSAELLRLERDNPKLTAKLAEDILQTAEQSAKTVRQLLALGRKEPSKAERIDLSEFLPRSERTLRRLLPTSVQLSVVAEPGLAISMDLGLLQQVLVNLVFNARDAMPDGGRITLAASLRSVKSVPSGTRAKPGELVCIDCQDEGVGMDAETLARIFEPFFTTKQPGRGTGLGLPVVLRTVEEAGGFVEVESKVGVGTRFRLYLPPAEPKQAAVDMQRAFPSRLREGPGEGPL